MTFKTAMNYTDFRIGFWHPFGPHSCESAEQILARKAREVEANGWTLWSFQHRPMLDEWHQQLARETSDSAFVFCSAGGGKDPIDRGGLAQAVDCQSYRFVGETEWRSMPAQIRVPHTFPSGEGRASAFVMRRIVHLAEPFELHVEWLAKNGEWRHDFPLGNTRRPGIPSRGEFLIRRGGTSLMRPARAILELRPPFLATVSTGLVPRQN